jgi:hypothetical protein
MVIGVSARYYIQSGKVLGENHFEDTEHIMRRRSEHQENSQRLQVEPDLASLRRELKRALRATGGSR